jgi:hypothetical protein
MSAWSRLGPSRMFAVVAVRTGAQAGRAGRPGQATATSRVLARTQITSPASSTSSMTSTDNPENTVPTSSITSITTDRDTSVQSATTGSATEPLDPQSLPALVAGMPRWGRFRSGSRMHAPSRSQSPNVSRLSTAAAYNAAEYAPRGWWRNRLCHVRRTTVPGLWRRRSYGREGVRLGGRLRVR